MNFRQLYPAEVQVEQEYDGFEFSWGDNGLKPARKNHLVTRQLANPVSFETLIEELKVVVTYVKEMRPICPSSGQSLGSNFLKITMT